MIVSDVLVANPLDDLRSMLAYPFMVHAFVAGTIVAIVAGAVGWFMVLRRESFAGHSLAVVGFPGAAGATLIGAPVALGYFGFCVAAAVLIAFGAPGAGRGARTASPAAIGTIQAAALATGVLFTALFHGFLGGVDALLFGDFLGVSSDDLVVLGVIGAVVVVSLLGIARPLLWTSIDPDAAAARGVPTRAIGVAFMILLGVSVAEVSEITGSLLVFALLVMPASSVQGVTARPVFGGACTIAIGVGVTWTALIASYYSPWPFGFFLTSVAFTVFLGSVVVRRRPRSSRTPRDRGVDQ